MDTTSIYIENLVGGGGAASLVETTAVLAANSIGPTLVTGFPGTGAYTVYISAANRQSVVAQATKATAAAAGTVSVISHTKAVGITETVNVVWQAGAALSITHNPIGAVATPVTYNVGYIGVD